MTATVTGCGTCGRDITYGKATEMHWYGEHHDCAECNTPRETCSRCKTAADPAPLETVSYRFTVTDYGHASDTLSGHLMTWHTDGNSLPGETLRQAHDRLHRENDGPPDGTIIEFGGDSHRHE